MASFDKATVDSLVSNLENGEVDLAARMDANKQATDAAAKAQADLTAAQATNRANVQAIKAYFAGLDDEGGVPAADAGPFAAATTATTTGDSTAAVPAAGASGEANPPSPAAPAV